MASGHFVGINWRTRKVCFNSVPVEDLVEFMNLKGIREPYDVVGPFAFAEARQLRDRVVTFYRFWHGARDGRVVVTLLDDLFELNMV